MKESPLKARNTAPTAVGMGDYYGMGVKNPTGKIREVFPVGYSETPMKNTKPSKPVSLA